MKFFRSLTLCLLSVVALRAQATKPAAPDKPVDLDPLNVSGKNVETSPIDKAVFPVNSSITAQRVEETINAVDTEDAVKYLPSVFLRKRNFGDTQAVMGTRVWGVSSSARSLIFADGIPLSALIANNNNIGGPRWGLVAPAEIDHIEMMYGPYSAAYAGNSMGAVMEITTRMPEKFEGSLNQIQAWQSYQLYGTHNIFNTSQTAVNVGDRVGKFSFWVSGNFQDSFSQPLTFVTNPTFPTGTTGGYAAQNKLGAAADVIGAGGLLHTDMTNAKFKGAYDLTPLLRLTYTFGVWQNDADSAVQSYLKDASGQPTFAGLAGFASGYYHLFEQHSSQSLSIKSDTKGDWNFEADASLYRMDNDKQGTPTTVTATGTGYGSAGKVAVLGGTGWSNLDLKGIWSPGGATADNTVSFGVHEDRYKLYNPTFNTPDWQAASTYTSVATEGDGKTQTQALWLQDAWKITQSLVLTVGGRYEDWRAYDGYNVNGATAVHQPTQKSDKFSPKATLAWTVSPQWKVTGSFGQAYRFATASELYQLVSTGSTFTTPNPNLKPDNDRSGELRIDRNFGHGHTRVSFFQDDIHDAIISQYNTLVPGSSQLYAFNSNVDHVRARGIEAVLDQDDIFVRGLGFSGSVTYLNARTLATSGQGQFGSAIGKYLPNIPEWRASLLVTYRPDDRWALSLGGRYSAKMFTTLDNVDVNPNTYQGFSAWFVADAHADFKLNRHWSAGAGIDNLLNRKYFLFHPFPQRTVIMDVKYAF